MTISAFDESRLRLREAVGRAHLQDISPVGPILEEQANQTDNSFPAYKTDPLHETHFSPLRAADLLAEPLQPPEWVLEDFLALGSLALLASKPKEGKSTLTYELAVKVAQGLPFLGRTTRKGNVLILAVEEHRRDVTMRLHGLGAAGIEGLFLSITPLAPSATLFTEIQRFIEKENVVLVIVDTLAAFWHVENENDASEMTKAVKPLLRLARESGACVLLIHHARKSDGSHGDEIRGSGALFGLVDVALVMKRHTVNNQRLLQAQSRYPETPSELVLELRESTYVALGDPASVGKAAKLNALLAALPDEWEDSETITKRAGLSRREGYRLLGILHERGDALRDGEGRKASPYRFQRNSIRATPLVYRQETNSQLDDTIHASPQDP